MGAVGALTWGVKARFRSYVQSSGEVRADRPAMFGDQLITFPLLQGTSLDEQLRFTGAVRFTAHGGMLSVLLAEPWIEAVGDELVLSVATDNARRVGLAKLDPVAADVKAGSTEWREMSASLMETGTELFHFMYPTAEQLDPVTVLIGRHSAKLT